MVGDGQSSSMQEPDRNITATSYIDIPTVLLQSEAKGGGDATFTAAVCVLGVGFDLQQLGDGVDLAAQFRSEDLLPQWRKARKGR